MLKYPVLDLIGSPPQERFERLIRLLCHALRAPMGFLGLSDGQSLYYLASQGIPVAHLPLVETFCKYTLLQRDEPFVVEDAKGHEGFARIPWVSGSPFVRAYAALPLAVEGQPPFGTLGIMDLQPRRLDEFGRQSLRDLAALALQEIYGGPPPSASNSSLHDVLDHVQEGVLTLDQFGVIESCNSAAEKIFGYLSGEVIGRSIMALIDTQSSFLLEEMGKGFNSAATLRALFGGEVMGQRVDGTTFSMELSMSDMEVSSTRKFAVIVRDITERKMVEQMKNDFISVVSHELRTPLTSICGSLGLLRGGVVGELPTKAHSMIEIAFNNSQRLVRLINDILDVEKMESGKMEFHFEILPLVPLLRQALTANEGYAKQFSVQFVLRSEITNALVFGDNDRLMQVMNNLLSNAAKFSPSGEEVEVIATQQGGYYRVSVVDKGPGIPEDFRERVFAKFAQADASSTRTKGGTGLGLNICKQLIEGMKGQIGFESTPGEGTTFFFELPRFETPTVLEQPATHDTLVTDPPTTGEE